MPESDHFFSLAVLLMFFLKDIFSILNKNKFIKHIFVPRWSTYNCMKPQTLKRATSADEHTINKIK